MSILILRVSFVCVAQHTEYGSPGGLFSDKHSPLRLPPSLYIPGRKLA